MALVLHHPQTSLRPIAAVLHSRRRLCRERAQYGRCTVHHLVCGGMFTPRQRYSVAVPPGYCRRSCHHAPIPRQLLRLCPCGCRLQHDGRYRHLRPRADSTSLRFFLLAVLEQLLHAPRCRPYHALYTARRTENCSKEPRPRYGKTAAARTQPQHYERKPHRTARTICSRMAQRYHRQQTTRSTEASSRS